MITYKGTGAAASAGTTSCTPVYPASVAAGDTLLLAVVSKYAAPTTPSGWTLLSSTLGGAGSPGVDDGPVYCSVYVRTADGTETGTVTVSIPGGNSAFARTFRYSSFGAVTATAVAVANNTASAAWSVTFGSDPGIISGDYCVVFSGLNSDNGAASAQTLSVPGMVTTGTGVPNDAGTSQGDDVRLVVSNHGTANTGVSTGAATYTLTESTGTPSGSTVMVVLREAAIQYGGRGALASGSTTLTMAYPANIAAGDLLACLILNKYPPNTPTTPSGWTLAAQASGGAGASGPDSGQVYSTIYTCTADGSETGSLTVSIPSSNAALGMITRYFRTGASLATTASGGGNNTPSTTWTVTTGPLDLSAGDFVVALSGSNTDSRGMSGNGVATPGTTWQSSGAAGGITTLGDDLLLNVSHHVCMTGASSTAPVFTMTTSGTDGATEPAGSTVLLVIRAAIVGQGGGTLAAPTVSATGSAPVTGAGGGTLGAPSVAASGGQYAPRVVLVLELEALESPSFELEPLESPTLPFLPA